jgi:nucleoside-diphosphate-sugar epimerase
MRIFFTGGSGKAGKHVVRHLAARGHAVTNADRVPLGAPGVTDLQVDLTDAGGVFSALTALQDLSELDLPSVPRYDAVVHFAAIPRILVHPDPQTYAMNTAMTWNVLDAAVRLGIPKIVFASSETVYGICFAQGEMLPRYLPVDEDHPALPQDAYALSKIANETAARGLQARSGADIYGLRINNVVEPHQYAQDFPAYVADPSLRRRNIFAYIDTRDLAQMVERCLATDGLGFRLYNVANDDTSVALPTPELIPRFYPGVELRSPLDGHASPYSNARAKAELGFAPESRWRGTLGQET